MKKYTNCKVTPANIKIRYLVAKAVEGKTLEDLAIKFGFINPLKAALIADIKKRLAKEPSVEKKKSYKAELKKLYSSGVQYGIMKMSRFMNTNKYNMTIPNSPLCPCCKKSMRDYFREWINDGSINDENLKIVEDMKNNT